MIGLFLCGALASQFELLYSWMNTNNFSEVFLPGLEEGLLPATLSGNNDIEEERRLLYVGLTRACNQAILSTAASRSSGPSSPSRFLKEIPADFLTVVEATPNRRRTRPGEQMELFQP